MKLVFLNELIEEHCAKKYFIAKTFIENSKEFSKLISVGLIFYLLKSEQKTKDVELQTYFYFKKEKLNFF